MIALLLLNLALGIPQTAESLDCHVRLVDGQGPALAGVEVRLIVDGSDDPTDPNSGIRATTDEQRRVHRSVDHGVFPAMLRLSRGFAGTPTHRARVGVELELLGRKALYWVTLDLLDSNEAVSRVFDVRFADASGQFTVPIVSYPETHDFALPDDPSGVRLSQIGIDVDLFDLELAEDSVNRRVWRAEIEIIKHLIEWRE